MNRTVVERSEETRYLSSGTTDDHRSVWTETMNPETTDCYLVQIVLNCMAVAEALAEVSAHDPVPGHPVIRKV